MATHQLGPESPRPFAVLSEDYTREVNIPHIPKHELFSLGPDYEKKMMDLIHRYLEIGTDDKLCYVGPEKGSIATKLQEKFCILDPITTVLPGHIHYQEGPSHKMVPIKISHVGAEEFFREEAQKPPQFNKVLLKDTIQYFSDPGTTYRNIMKTIKDFGKLLIIYRPAPMNTLPLSFEAKERLSSTDQCYMTIIQDLQALYYDVQWEIECLPTVLPKVKWYAMMNEKFPPQFEGISNYEIKAGIRELSEGVLKYEGDYIEFVDRLLFISASHSVFSDYPSIQRFSGSAVKPFPGLQDLRYQMNVTPELKPFLQQRIQKEKENQIFKKRKEDLGIV